MENEFTTGALCKSPEEMDKRDFQTEMVFWTVTDEMLKDLPEEVDLIKEINETYKQGSIPCCTATALCHAVLIENIFDHLNNKIFLDQKKQWTENQGKERKSDESGDYLENALKSARKNGIKGKLADGTDFSFKIDGYSYSGVNTDFERFLKTIAYYLKIKRPLYWNLRGNSKTSKEMSAGEIKTVYKYNETTRGHAIVLWKIDFKRKIVWFANSRQRNTVNKEWTKTLSVFEISFDIFEQLIKNNVFGWRYREIRDFKDIKSEALFIDFAGVDTDTEQYKAVKRAKENWYIKGVSQEWWNRLEPNRPMTRLEMLLVLFRIFGWKPFENK